MSESLTLEDVAEELKVSYSTAKNLVNLYGLPYIAIGKRKIVRRRDLKAWIEKNRIVRELK